jgi:nickel-dependent lactate racemase
MIDLKCGEKSFPLELPPERVLAVIRPRTGEPAGIPAELVASALDGCTAALSQFRPGESVVIVTSDVTRPTGSEIYLPLVVARLNAAGIYLGETARGIPVEVNRSVAEADRLILTGAVTFHYFAGFGGGRKSLLPGVSSRRSCMASHFALLNIGEGSGKNPRAVTGNLEGNPVHEAMLEACAMRPPDFILNTVLTPDKRILAAFAGDWREAHLDGCRFYARTFSYPIRERADLVVVSCGGFPKDINLIQAHKSMEYASRALKPGGVMLLLAECRDGFGNATFFDWFRYPSCGELESALRVRYEINGQTAWSVKEKAERFRIVLVSRLAPAEVSGMGMIPAQTLRHALDQALPLLPEGFTAYVIPEGGTVLPVLA